MRGVFPVWADLSASLRSPVSFADSVYYNTGRKQIVITSQASAGAKSEITERLSSCHPSYVSVVFSGGDEEK